MEKSPLIDLCIRTGFRDHRNGNAARTLYPLLASVTRYELDAPLGEALPAVAAGTAPWVAFADDALRIPEQGMRKLERALARGTVAAVVFHTPALHKIHAAAESKVQQNGGSPLLNEAASWFVLVRRDALQASGFFSGTWQTLEYALLAFSAWARSRRAPILRIDGTEPQVHADFWTADLLLTAGNALAADRALARALYPELSPPPQFDVELVGGYADEASLDASQPLLFKPLFSVLCPAYKSRFLEETISSVLAQTYGNFEFIVVVDGPPRDEEDAISAILQRHADDVRLRFEFRDNHGTGPTRAYLATLAQGEYITSVDDDDYLAPETLELFARVLQAHPDAQIVRGGIQIFGFVDHYLRPRPRRIVAGIPVDYFEANQPWLVRRDLWKQLGGFEGDPNLSLAGEDSDFFLKADDVRAESWLIDRPLYFRRLSSYNQTLSSGPGDFQRHLQWLNGRHAPAHWKEPAFSFEERNGYLHQTALYSGASGESVLTATRYFNYNTKGECSEVIIDLEVTALCNADCTFCPRENLGRKDRYIALSHVQNLADTIAEEGSRRKVVLCGIGEPTLHPQIEEIVGMLKRAGATVCMTNNGSRMTPALFSRLAEAGLTEMNFSVNAATAETRELVMRRKDFAKVRQNVLEVLAHRDAHCPGVDINVSFVLCPQNQHEVHDFIAMWRSTSVRRCWVHPVNNRANLLPEEVAALDPREIHARYDGDDRVVVDLWEHGFQPEYPEVCTIAQTLMFISADGDMLLCALDHERRNIVGNLRDMSALRLHLEKIARYRRGDFAGFCQGCTYCPKTREYARLARAAGVGV